MKPAWPLLLSLLFGFSIAHGGEATAPIVADDVVFEERDGVVAVEAEHFFKQTRDGVRAWHITSSLAAPGVSLDGDEPHIEGASGGAYVEALPDTRHSDKDQLVSGENFSNEPDNM